MKICEECHGTGRVGGPLEAYLEKNGSFACSLGKVGTCEKCGGRGRTGDPSKPEPMIVTGSVAFALERDALKAERDRLARELEETKAELDSVNRSEDAIQAGSALKYLLELQRELAMARAELERLREVRAGSLRAGIGGNLCIEGVSDSFIAAIPEELLAQLKMTRAELARMRPVVEAAAEYRDEFCADCGDGGCEATDCKLARAVDAYRAGAGKGDE